MFDLHRDLIPIDSMYNVVKNTIPNLGSNEVSEREKYHIVWRYFHNYRAEDVKTGQQHPIHYYLNKNNEG